MNLKTVTSKICSDRKGVLDLFIFIVFFFFVLFFFFVNVKMYLSPNCFPHCFPFSFKSSAENRNYTLPLILALHIFEICRDGICIGL